MAVKKTPPHSESTYRAPALEKGLDILEILAVHPEGLTQGQVAGSLNRSVNEIFRMLNVLERRGFITSEKPLGRYVLTFKLFELAHLHPPTSRLIEEALPLLRATASRIRQSCHLAVYHDGQALVVAQVDSPDNISLSVRTGSIISLLNTASGHVLLAYQTADRRRLMLDQAGVDCQAIDGALGKALQRIREDGFEVSDSAQISGAFNVSFPVLDYTGTAMAAMTVPYIQRLDRDDAPKIDEVKRVVGKAAGELSRRLGSGASISKGALRFDES